ncbi:MAG: MFS transporter [Alphaproteobacteria bacterium]
MSIFAGLRRDQREAIGLLQVGTFLEYFDLMLYVHMAVLLNDLFFPATDPHTAALIGAFAFCSTYVLRPFGALLFGYIGDKIGRKTTVIITTTSMAISCVVMANLPTYAQIGISAAWIVTICRIMQGLSSMGEIIGATIYVMEITKPPLRYPAVALIGCTSRVGTVVALIVASLVTSHGLNWRIAFWIGATIALVGSVARTRLRETPEFSDMKRRMAKAIEDAGEAGLGKAAALLKNSNSIWKEKIGKKTVTAFFVTECAFAVCFYFTFMHCGLILKNTFHYTAEQIIHQNLVMSIFQMVSYFLFTFMAFKICPLKIVRLRAWAFVPFVILFPFVMENVSSTTFFILQAFSAFFVLTGTPAVAVFMEHFPVFGRFTYVSTIYAGSRAIVYVITSFGLVYLTEYLGHWGMWIILAPTTVGFIWAVKHFEKLREGLDLNTAYEPQSDRTRVIEAV